MLGCRVASSRLMSGVIGRCPAGTSFARLTGRCENGLLRVLCLHLVPRRLAVAATMYSQRGRRYSPPVVHLRTGELAAGQEVDDHAHGDPQPLGDLAGAEGFNRHRPYRRRLLAGALSPKQPVPTRRLGRDSTRATVPPMVKGVPFAGRCSRAAIKVSL